MSFIVGSGARPRGASAHPIRHARYLRGLGAAIALVLGAGLASVAPATSGAAAASGPDQVEPLVASSVPGVSRSAPVERRAGLRRGPGLGVQFHGVWSSYSDAERGRALDRLVAMGASWVRIDMSWAMLQPTADAIDPGSWGVQHTDNVIRMARARGLKVLGMFWLTPPWANGGAGERTAPHDPADYARALAWAGRHWKGQVHAWEVWNEPNSQDFLASADPGEYTRLLCRSRSALRSSGVRTPVVFGGLMYNDTAWISRAYEAGAKGCFDVMATHPYVAPANQPVRPAGAGRPTTLYDFEHLGSVRRTMRSHGDLSPVWVTEFGWSSHRNDGGEAPWERGVTPAQQARFTTQALNAMRKRYPFVRKAFVYTDRAQPGVSQHLAGYGLMHSDLSPKPVYAALRTWTRRHN